MSRPRSSWSSRSATRWGPMAAELFGQPGALDSPSSASPGTNGKTTTTYPVRERVPIGGVGAGRPRYDGRSASTGRPARSRAPRQRRPISIASSRGCARPASKRSRSRSRRTRSRNAGVDGLVVDVALFTNLSQDHLDFHPSMESYFDAKAALFTPDHARTGVVNADDPWGRRLLERPAIPVTTYRARHGRRPAGERRPGRRRGGLVRRCDGVAVRQRPPRSVQRRELPRRRSRPAASSASPMNGSPRGSRRLRRCPGGWSPSMPDSRSQW